MAKDLSALDKAGSDLYDAAFADGVASVQPGQPVQGVSPGQEKADIDAAVAAAVKPLQDQIAALQADDAAKDALAQQLQATVDKIKALLA